MNHFSSIARALDAYGIDAMLLTGAPNRFYASGFLSPGTDGVALVTREKNYYMTDFRYIEAARDRIADARVEMTERGRGVLTILNECIAEHGLRRIGYEETTMTVAEQKLYAEKLTAEMVPCAALPEKLREVKDADELAAMVDAQRIAERAFAEVLNEIRPGVTEREIAARLTYLMLHFGAENMSFDPIVVSGANGSMPHGVPSEKTIASGEFVTMDFGCICRGYCSDMTRTVAVGQVSGEMEQVYGIVLQAQERAIAGAKAGMTGRAVDALARDVIEQAGYGAAFGHAFGHSLGIEVHEDPNATPSNNSPLPAGAVISAEPGIYLPGKFGVRIEDVIVLNETGCEDITRAPKQLIVL